MFKEDNTTLRKLQLLELKILLEIDRICKKNNIRYFLCGGTLIGAIRHSGFIPWDDDLDISMPRKDYNKFIEISQSELSSEYYLQTKEYDHNYPSNFIKIRLKGTEYSSDRFSVYQCVKGIWVDIFPLDSISENKLSQQCYTYKLRLIGALAVVNKGVSLTYLAKNSLQKLLYGIINCGFSIVSNFISDNSLNRKWDKTITKYNNKVTQYCFEYTPIFIYPKKIYERTLYVEFEGFHFPVPSGYDEYLTIQYGDYMKLPPIEKRVTHSKMIPELGSYSSITYEDFIQKK